MGKFKYLVIFIGGVFDGVQKTYEERPGLFIELYSDDGELAKYKLAASSPLLSNGTIQMLYEEEEDN